MRLSSFRWWWLPAFGLIAVGIAVSEYRALRASHSASPAAALAELAGAQPWSGLAGRRRAAALELGWRQDPALADQGLAWHLARYPLDPWRWLDRAAIARLTAAPSEHMRWHLDAAVAIQPANRALRWRASTLAVQAGEYRLAEEHLRQWLVDQPAGTGRALFVAERWLTDPAPLLDRILPPGDAYLEAALAHARQQRRLDLGTAAWQRLSQAPSDAAPEIQLNASARPQEEPRTPDPPGSQVQGPTQREVHTPVYRRPEPDRALRDFVELALALDAPGQAMQAWADQFTDYRPGQIPNGDFRHPLHSRGGLDWNLRLPAGATATHDHEIFVTAPASLHLMFDGSENLRLSQPSVRIPVSPSPERWILRGHWRAEGLTTRALPYLRFWAHGGSAARVDVPGPGFDWTPFEIELAPSPESALLHLQLRRDPPARDFDRFLSGRLWIDALTLTKAPHDLQ